jgi:hypothetical protein
LDEGKWDNAMFLRRLSRGTETPKQAVIPLGKPDYAFPGITQFKESLEDTAGQPRVTIDGAS